MIKAVIYNILSERIERIVFAPASHIALQCQEGEAYVVSATAGDETHYFNTELAAIRTKGDYTIDALPLPCTVTIEGVEYAVTEQPTLTFNYPGTYVVKIDAGVRFLEKEFEILWP
tara:strand:- start:5056 stop:5403 length:348 start_codon:yes stop_codon:yes gene_type:complete